MQNSERNQNVVKFVELLKSLGMVFYGVSLAWNRFSNAWEVWVSTPGTGGLGWKNAFLARYESVDDAVDCEMMIRQNITAR